MQLQALRRRHGWLRAIGHDRDLTPPSLPNGLPIHRVDLPGTRAVTVARRLRRRRAHGAPGGERDGALPRAPRLQGRREVRRLQQGQRDGRADGRGCSTRTRRTTSSPSTSPCRAEVVARGDRPADGLRRAARRSTQEELDRERGVVIQEIARAQRPAVRRRRAPDRPRRVRRPPARPPRARARGAPAHVLAATRSSPSAGASGPARAAARSSSATSSTCRRTRSWSRRSAASRRSRPTARYEPAPPLRARRRSSRRATPTSRTCASPTARRSTRRDRAQRAALAVYGTLLGGSMGSRLFDEIREQRGLAYSVYSVDHSFADVPILQLSAGPRVGQVRRGLHAHARDRRRAAHGRARARRRSSARAPTPPAARVLAFENTNAVARHAAHADGRVRAGDRPRRGDRACSTRSPSTHVADVARAASREEAVGGLRRPARRGRVRLTVAPPLPGR